MNCSKCYANILELNIILSLFKIVKQWRYFQIIYGGVHLLLCLKECYTLLSCNLINILIFN